MPIYRYRSRFISDSMMLPALNRPRADAWDSDYRRQHPNQSPERERRVKLTVAKTYETRPRKIE